MAAAVSLSQTVAALLSPLLDWSSLVTSRAPCWVVYVYGFAAKELEFLVPRVLKNKTFCYAPRSGMPEELAYNGQSKFYCGWKPFACDQFTINNYPGTNWIIIELARGNGGMSSGFFGLLSKKQSVSFAVWSKYEKLRSTVCSILPWASPVSAVL